MGGFCHVRGAGSVNILTATVDDGQL
jgi:hypothetical protein